MENNQMGINDTKIIRLLIEDRYRNTRHLILLLGILAIICFSKEMTVYTGTYKYFRLVCIYTSIIGMSYVNMYILVPKLFFRNSYLPYLICLFILVFTCLIIVSYLLDSFSPEPDILRRKFINRERGIYEGVVILIPIILVTTMIKLFQRWTRDNGRISELKQLTFNMELNELRNQINPHFLFNMLSGIKALIRTDPEKADAVIIKLSEFLRYQLYDNTDSKTLLKSEICFLVNFLELEKLRRDNFSVTVTSPNDSPVLGAVFLPPNLFTTFVENAVKHSINISQTASYIKVHVTIEGNKLFFSCANSIDPEYRRAEKNSGLGLVNIKRRLELLYGDSYDCTVTVTQSEYKINLTLPL